MRWVWTIPVGLASVGVGLLAAGRLSVALRAIRDVQMIDYGEPIVYGQANRLLDGIPLYQSLTLPPYTVTPYTPLYYVLAASLHALFGAGFGPGRALSTVCAVICAGLIALVTFRRTRSRWAGAFAALMFLGIGFPFTSLAPWFGLYRVDMLGVALSLGSFAILEARPRPWGVVLAGIFAGLAFLTKQTFVAMLLAGSVWLLLRRDVRLFLFAGSAASLIVIVSGILELSTGSFLANTVVANFKFNPPSHDAVGLFIPLFLKTLGVPVALATLYLLMARAWMKAETSLLLLYWLVSVIPILGVVKAGANSNYWIEFAAVTAILATIGIWTSWSTLASSSGSVVQRYATVVAVWLFVAIMVAGAPGAIYVTGYGLQTDGQLSGLPASSDDDFRALVERVRGEPGDVLADPLDVVVLAGRQVLLEPLFFSVLEEEGGWDPDPLVSRICAGDVSLLVLAAPIEPVARYAPYGLPWWPRRVMGALLERMVLQGQTANRLLYVPGPRLGAVQTALGGTVCP